MPIDPGVKQRTDKKFQDQSTTGTGSSTVKGAKANEDFDSEGVEKAAAEEDRKKKRQQFIMETYGTGIAGNAKRAKDAPAEVERKFNLWLDGQPKATTKDAAKALMKDTK